VSRANDAVVLGNRRSYEWQAHPSPQEPGIGDPQAVIGDASVLPVAAKIEMSFTTSLWPTGHSTADDASATDRRSSNEVSHVLQRYS
jgi:hypothetical protein